MPEADENLEDLVRRAPHRDASAPRPTAGESAGQCECGARITGADLYGERSDVDLGRPRRRPTARFLQYLCPLCGRTGELMAD